MNIFVARQPIFDRSNNVVAYELLYRNGYENFYNNIDGNKATVNVITNSFYTFDIKNITNNKKVFINFTEELIKKEIATILPSGSIVIEILEDIEPTDEVILACKTLKKRGFTLALDDFIFDKKYINFIKLADIIKIDFKVTKGEDRKSILELSNINGKIKFLAEKIENDEDYHEAFKLGYTYFQGYYFSEPVILSKKSIPVNKHIALEIMKIINNEDFNYSELEALIMQDLGISYKILKLINSSLYYLRSKVSSIRSAITYIGKQELAKWLYIVLLNDLKGETPNELIKVSLQRAKLCEFICGMSIYKEKKFSAYMTGLFSLADVLLNCPIKVILNDLCMVDEIKEGLLEEKTPLNVILKLVIYYEKGQWDNVIFYANKIKVDVTKISEMYLECLEWADSICCN